MVEASITRINNTFRSSNSQPSINLYIIDERFSVIIVGSQKEICGRSDQDHIVVGFTTTCAISAYHHKSCEFESCSWWGVLDTTLCDKVCYWLAAGWWFSPGTLGSFTNKKDCPDITEILLKVALNTITLTLNQKKILI